ncbi:hypothetical protein LN475_21090 [Xanthomonas vesicatoria]|uniref:hypothetical protein n=1 Tax=Xanthomonas vesicatoria TaxID=56460 RepID=UPI00073BC95F|nr:hypothetical protein [Xanthomonas vesicatoria]KTF33841.1 hypothetical protein LMG920_08270 [Xanthomonas vesicatoria]MCC8599106.1 hypothetical protein [Xanthomonas vesicatoria]MCC8603904.1 hypothetical protein [Xanthomonas vesicatoria]
MTYFALPPRAAATPCLALVTLVPALALMTTAQMRRLAASELRHVFQDDASDDASRLHSPDHALCAEPPAGFE